MDPSIVLTAMKSLQTAVDIGKTLRSLDKSIDDAEIKMKIADLINALADAKFGIAELKTELEKKDEIIARLEEALKIQSEIEFRDGFYFQPGDDVPFCPRCWEKDNRLIHCGNETFDRNEGYYYRICPDCKASLKTRDVDRDSSTYYA